MAAVTHPPVPAAGVWDRLYQAVRDGRRKPGVAQCHCVRARRRPLLAAARMNHITLLIHLEVNRLDCICIEQGSSVFPLVTAGGSKLQPMDVGAVAAFL